MHTKMVQGDKQGDSWKNYAHIVNMKREKGSFHRRRVHLDSIFLLLHKWVCGFPRWFSASTCSIAIQIGWAGVQALIAPTKLLGTKMVMVIFDRFLGKIRDTCEHDKREVSVVFNLHVVGCSTDRILIMAGYELTWAAMWSVSRLGDLRWHMPIDHGQL